MNKYIVKEWMQDNATYIYDHARLQHGYYMIKKDNYGKEFHDLFRKQCFEKFKSFILDGMSYTLGYSYEDCNNETEDELQNIWTSIA